MSGRLRITEWLQSVSDTAQRNYTTRIESPRSQRSLKHDILDPEAPDIEVPNPKRLCTWLQSSTRPRLRSRSDSFLYTMSNLKSRPVRAKMAIKRYEDKPPVPPASLLRPPSSSIHPHSSASHVNVPDVETLASELRSCSRVAQHSYRHDLALNNIYINPKEMSLGVVTQASTIVKRMRDSPGLTDAEARAASDDFRWLRENAEEGKVRSSFYQFGIIPWPNRLREGIVQGDDIPFSAASLPSVPLGPPLPPSRPDYHYCFDKSQFSIEQDTKLSAHPLKIYGAPSTTGYWPFLVVEFKSHAKQGSIWVAENQAATSGAQLVSSMEQLLSMCGEQHEETDSITFSATADPKNVTFWVHYCSKHEQGGQTQRRFCSVELEQFYMGRTVDIINCQAAFQNIFEWAMKTRLPAIHAILDRIKLTI